MKPRTGVPPIGQRVLHLTTQASEGTKDWVCSRRLGDEQGVLEWGVSGERWKKTDTWCEYYVNNKGEICDP